MYNMYGFILRSYCAYSCSNQQAEHSPHYNSIDQVREGLTKSLAEGPFHWNNKKVTIWSVSPSSDAQSTNDIK